MRYRSADKWLASRLLDLCVVCAASSNANGWSTVETLTGGSWRDYCTDEEHALVVKVALASQEKRATDAYERERKDRERKEHDRGAAVTTTRVVTAHWFSVIVSLVSKDTSGVAPKGSL